MGGGRIYLPFFLPVLLLCVIISVEAAGQDKRAIKGEPALCEILLPGPSTSKTVAGVKPPPAQAKTHKPLLNQVGHFDQVSNIVPQQKVPVTISYPNARAGDRIVIMVLDGGFLEANEKARIVQLDRQKKIAFTFQAATDPGLYRIALRKGNDVKIVQLWVGEEIMPVKR
jgi:hypothetical protein